MKAIDLTGQTIGRLSVIAGDVNDGKGRTKWICRCDCGALVSIRTSSLCEKLTRSCGCLKREVHTTHGHTRSPEYTAWKIAKGQCFNPNHRRFKNYGGRGISMCARWKRSFLQFLLDMGWCPDGARLERKNNNGNYTPSNCIWKSTKQNRLLTIDDVSGSIVEWCKPVGLRRGTKGKTSLPRRLEQISH